MSDDASAGTPQVSAGPLAVDLRSAEEQYRARHGVDFTEVKEAMVDALLRSTEQHCSGSGNGGAVIYGARPSSRLVSSFLLPRYDSTGNEDETSDIHIATMGMDLQIAAGSAGQVTVQPELSAYIRELPTWAELTDPRNDMRPQVQLSRDARQEIEQRARGYIEERIAALPPLEEDPDPDRAGDALAQAEREHERLDVPEESAPAADTPEARGIARAAAETAERAERAAAAHQTRSRQRIAARNERNAAIAAIRREAFDRVFVELGISIVTATAGTRPLNAGDLAEGEHTEVIEAGIEDAQDRETTAQPPPEPEEGPAPATGAVGPVRPQAGRIDDHFAAPQPIPQKWRRWSVPLGDFTFDIASEESRTQAVTAFETALQTQLTQMLTAWLATEEGQRDAYRPNERILPSNFADEASWNRYLAALRASRPATLADVRPDLTGMTLVADLDPDFTDATRKNLRIALQNDAAMPSGREPSAYEHAVFQVVLQVSLPEAVHRPLRLDRLKPSYRFRDWFEYPAMGLNCGVRAVAAAESQIALRTTWAPRYVQPRIEPNSIPGVPTSYAELADLNGDPSRLLALPTAYDGWIDTQGALDAGAGLEGDPMRSTVEHDALRRRKVDVASEAGNLRLAHAELCAEYGVRELEQAYQRRVGQDLARAGIQDAYLIRNLDMVEFSFGFTRVSATPITVQKDRPMPVRLKGFPRLQNDRRPIYAIEQQNEAIYMRLDPGAVAAWLVANGVLPAPPAAPRTLGSVLIENYADFGPFLQGFTVRDPASRVRTRDVPSLVYLLLHTMAHHVMHGISRFSGLDLGSMSEAVFPADLAFLVHRRGMTEDLGNISSMWRDHNGAFLDYLVARRELRCGSGTLCDHRGGACPACIMVPETSCIAGNQLLSRAALVGGRAPLWDNDQSHIRAYFEVVRDLRNAAAAGGGNNGNASYWYRRSGRSMPSDTLQAEWDEIAAALIDKE